MLFWSRSSESPQKSPTPISVSNGGSFSSIESNDSSDDHTPMPLANNNSTSSGINMRKTANSKAKTNTEMKQRNHDETTQQKKKKKTKSKSSRHGRYKNKHQDPMSVKYQYLIALCLVNSLLIGTFVTNRIVNTDNILSSSFSDIRSIFPSSNANRKNTEEFLKSLNFTEKSANGDGNDHTDIDNNANRKTSSEPFKYPMLPQRIYTVIGLESSGTSFTARAIKEALNVRKTREAHKYYPLFPMEPERTEADLDSEADPVQVQHFSLPWGSSCHQQSETPVVDVVLPTPCTRNHEDNADQVYHCNAMADDLFGFRPNGKPVQYPPRYNLDIVSHKKWYDAHGVDQWMVIVMRDPDISAEARRGSHCKDEKRLKEEDQMGTDIILDAINKYVLGVDERKVTRETYKFWYAKNFNKDASPGIMVKKNKNDGGRKLRASASVTDSTSHDDRRKLQVLPPAGGGTLLPKGNNVVLVSYESMMKLGDVYLKMLYEALEIDTDYVPTVKNGNTKYVQKQKK